MTENKKAGGGPAFLFRAMLRTYLRFLPPFLAALRPRFFVALRAPFLAALRPPFFAAFRPPLFFAAILSLHDEVKLSAGALMAPASTASRPRPARVVTMKTHERALCFVTGREYRTQGFCTQWFSSREIAAASLPKAPHA
jgi:hypothetical protein